MDARRSLELFAGLVRWTTEDCVARGYEKWIAEVLKRRPTWETIELFRAITGGSPSDGKRFMAMCNLRPAPLVNEIAQAIAADDGERTVALFISNYGDAVRADLLGRFAAALFFAFTPRAGVRT